jgi:hypothetical protein
VPAPGDSPQTRAALSALIRSRFRVGTSGSPSLRLKEVMDMRRYLLVLDMDLLALDEEHGLEPINYLVAKPLPCARRPGDMITTR